jgi:hypothetical protein
LYNPTSIPHIVIKEGSSGPIDIIDHGPSLILYNNGDRWMSYLKNKDLEIKELYSSYDLAYGDVLVSGLGFGILALWLCSKPEVNSVTVVEISEDVIKLFKDANVVPEKLKIINDNMITYNTDIEYDVLLLDHYERQLFEWKLKDIMNICSRIKHKVFWAWSLEHIYLYEMYKEFDVQVIINKNGDDLSTHWSDFRNKFFPKEIMLKNINSQKLNEYIYTYFNKEIYGV